MGMILRYFGIPAFVVGLIFALVSAGNTARADTKLDAINRMLQFLDEAPDFSDESDSNFRKIQVWCGLRRNRVIDELLGFGNVFHHRIGIGKFI